MDQGTIAHVLDIERQAVQVRDEAERRAEEIVQHARRDAEKRRHEILVEARRQADQIVAEGREEAETRREHLLSQAEEEARRVESLSEPNFERAVSFVIHEIAERG